MAIRKFKPSSPDKALGKIKGDIELARFGHLNRLVDDTTAEIKKAVEESTNLDFKIGSVGPKVSFKKESGTDPETHKDVIIPGLLEITRGNGGGIYNIAIEGGFNGNVSPENTFWSTPYVDAAYRSWAPLWDVQSRTFDTWRNAIRTPNNNYDYAPPQYVGMPVVMAWHEGGSPAPTRYWLIMFTEWGVGGNNQYGFAYDRWEIFPSVNFEKPNYETSTVDKISDGVWLARNNNGGLYNRVNEDESYAGLSPKNTRWNSSYVDSRAGYSGFSDLSNLESRVYTDFTHALNYAVGSNILGTDLIMHDLTTDLYYKFQFSGWTQGGNGGGFAYTRTVIPQSIPIKFADGTIMNTATTGGNTSGLPYKVYSALLSHQGTSDPSVIVLENTLGSDITWKRSGSVGIFYGQNSNFSDATKVWMNFQPNYSNQGNGNVRIVGSEILLDGVSGPTPALWFTTEIDSTGGPIDNWGAYIPVEIRIYP